MCTSFLLTHKILYFAVGKRKEKKCQEKGHLFTTVVLSPSVFLETWRASLNKSHQTIFKQFPTTLSKAWPSLGQATHRNQATHTNRDGRDATGLHLCIVRITCTCRVWKVMSTNRWLLRWSPLQLLWATQTHSPFFFKCWSAIVILEMKKLVCFHFQQFPPISFLM